MFVDTHTHLYLSEFDGDRDEVIERAMKSRVEIMLLPNIDFSTVDDMLRLSTKYPGICLPMIGLHPGSVKENYMEELQLLLQWADKKEFYAIGEVGMDLYWDKTYLEEQKDAFAIQIHWARERKLPLVIHSREAFYEIFQVLEKELEAGQTGVFHSFTGGKEEVRKILEMDFYFGINGIASFKNSNLKEVILQIPPERLLLETDSPFLAPVPRRGRRNESSFLPYIADAVASVYGMGIEELSAITTKNAKQLFDLN